MWWSQIALGQPTWYAQPDATHSRDFHCDTSEATSAVGRLLAIGPHFEPIQFLYASRRGREGSSASSFASVIDRCNQPRSSHRRLTVDSRAPSPDPLYTNADAPTSKDRCATSGSFIAVNTITFVFGFTSV